MPCYAIKLYFQSPLHMGQRGLGMEDTAVMIHSDTLYSVLHRTWLRLYPAAGPLPLRLTSAYPFVGDVFYLPKPGLEAPGFSDTTVRETYAKDVKDTPFISSDIFSQWIRGDQVDYGKMLKDNQLLGNNLQKEVRPRVKIDRINRATSLYRVGEVNFRRNVAGLYFVLHCSQDVYERMKTVISLLEEEGIGGERSSGYGRFKAEYLKNHRLPEVSTGKRWVGLSLYYPSSQEELFGAMVSYQVYERCGWTRTKVGSYLQKSILMFSEGSVYKKEVSGAVADVAPTAVEHPVYRFGKAFLVKVR